MSFLTEIKNKARSLARDGLEKAGFTVHELPDDIDESMDIIDRFRELSEQRSAPENQVDPIPPEDRQALKKWMLPLCNRQKDVMEFIEEWIEHREDIIPFQPEIKSAGPEQIRREALDRLLHAGLIQHAGDDGLAALQNVARAQDRAVINLLRMASYQCMSASLEEWVARMNEKLSRYDLAIVRIDNDLVSLVNSDDQDLYK